MELCGRKVIVSGKVPATWLFISQGIDYTDGRNPLSVTYVCVEKEDGRIMEVLPGAIRFIKEEKPELLADSPGQ